MAGQKNFPTVFEECFNRKKDKVKTWAPTFPCKVSDNIISSQYMSQKVFVPSYEREKRPCIEQLLTNEYQRIWWQEKEAWDKRYLPAKTTTAQKLLPRQIIKKKSSTKPPEKPTRIRRPKKKKDEAAIKTNEGTQEEEQKNKEVKKPAKKITKLENVCAEEIKKVAEKQ